MKARLSKTILSVILAALAISSCQPPVTATPTALPSDTPQPQPTATPASQSEKIKQGVDNIMQGFMKGGEVSACGVAVVSPDAGGKLAQSIHSFGTLTHDGQTPAGDNTEYEIGSLTKLFTATVLAAGDLKGVTPSGDPLQKYMTEDFVIPSFAGNDITLYQLATHTSGLPRRAQGIGGKRKVEGLFQEGFASDAEIARFLSTYHLTRGPGDTWEYSNVGYGLLGVAEARALGTSYEGAVINEVAGPLGMSHTRVVLQAGELSSAAQGYDSAGGKAVPFTTTGNLLGAGGLRSTIGDLAIFLQASIAPNDSPLAGPLLLTQQAVVDGPDPAISQGLGWMISNAGRPDAVHFKAGLTPGFSAYIAFSQAKQAGFVVACNAPGVTRVVPDLNKLLGQESAPTDESEVMP